MTKKNYKYGKLVDGKLVYAPNKLKTVIGDDEGNEIAVQVINATAAQYAMSGWLPIRRTQQPEPVEGGYYSARYEEKENAIVESWVFVAAEGNGDE